LRHKNCRPCFFFFRVIVEISSALDKEGLEWPYLNIAKTHRVAMILQAYASFF